MRLNKKLYHTKSLHFIPIQAHAIERTIYQATGNIKVRLSQENAQARKFGIWTAPLFYLPLVD
jgi:hypothetical protein